MKSVHVFNAGYSLQVSKSLKGYCRPFNDIDVLAVKRQLSTALFDRAWSCGIRVGERTDGTYSWAIRQGFFLEETSSAEGNFSCTGNRRKKVKVISMSLSQLPTQSGALFQ